ncbi:unnamed protein product [Musa acuminata subsp. malaccensis]|uniref:Formin-like protein n=1 Tax=Musa acuminata subsp. malaccensis TaxID=214687 RepID=A0A804JXP6_MUSAM|nr:PREDICTED: formin-like protein 11 isoform X1 [Musa acuminata subsp. malaccensis]CAG1857204.1 unnamed protein product [Musa acuminata subsp. malaccensis]
MVSASRFLRMLVLVLVSTFLFLNSRFMGASWALHESRTILQFESEGREVRVEAMSGEDNAGGDLGTRLITRVRFLLGMKIPKHRRAGHARAAYSPAPAPAIGAETPAPVPLFKTHVLPASPLHRRPHIAPVQILEYGSGREAKERHRRRILIVVVVACAGATLVVLGVAVTLACKRAQRRTSKKRPERLMLLPSRIPKLQASAAAAPSNKVSFDPCSDQFYLNSLTKYLESDLSLHQTPQLKSVASVESMTNLEHMKSCESDNVSCLDEENIPAETACRSDNGDDDDDDDSDSFHSVSSHPLNQSVSSSEENFSRRSEICSPISSYRSTSSSHNNVSSSYGTTSAIPARNFVIPQKVTAPTDSFLCSSSRRFGGRDSRPRAAPRIEDRSSLSRSEPSTLGFVHSIESHDLESSELCSKLEMASVESSPSDELKSSPAPSKADLLSTAESAAKEPMTCPHQSKSVSPDGNGNGKAGFSPPMPLVSNGRIPKPPGPPPLPPPPPIRPPPFPKGCSSGHAPPPPPCPAQLSTPVGKDGTPLPKLKPLHWDKVRAAPDRSMVWDKIRSSSFEFDEKMIESLFGYNLRSSSRTEEGKSKTPSPSKHVMEHKRLQNITILMKALNANAEQVRNALTLGEGLTVQQLEALVKMAPTKEEEEKLSNVEGNDDELDPAEKFLKAVLQVSFTFQRSEVMFYRETFEDEVAHLRNSFAMIEEACKELRSSRLFFRLLEAVLKTGNRMNVGTIRGGARAFKLDALLKLADVKGTDGKTTLLHFVVQEIVRLEGVNAMETETEKHKSKTAEEKEEDHRATGLKLVSGLITELGNVKKTASMDLDVLISSVSNLSSGLSQSKQLVEQDMTVDDKSKRFVHRMRSFLNEAEKIVKELKDDENQVLLQVRNIAEYYHGDVSKDEANPLRIFVIVRDFLCMLDRVCKEVGNSKTHQGPISLLLLDRRG